MLWLDNYNRLGSSLPVKEKDSNLLLLEQNSTLC